MCCWGVGWGGGGAGSRGKITLRSAFMNEGWGSRRVGEEPGAEKWERGTRELTRAGFCQSNV